MPDRRTSRRRQTEPSSELSPPVLDISLGVPTEEKLAIRKALRTIAGACPEHDNVNEVVRVALELAESAMMIARRVVAEGSGMPSDAKRDAERAASLELELKRLTEAYKLLLSDPEHLGQRQAFVLNAVNYAAEQVPFARSKLAKEIVLYAVWKMGGGPFEILTDETALQQAEVVIAKWRGAGGRGHSRWQPAQAFLQRFGLGAKTAAALKETAEKYKVRYVPPEWDDGSHTVVASEFDIIAGRFNGCRCCRPDDFDSFQAAKK